MSIFRHLPNFLLIALVFYSTDIAAQSTQIDLLKKSIETASDNKSKLRAMLIFCYEWESYSPDTLERYASLAQQMAEEQKDEKAVLLCNYYYAVFFTQKGKLDTALKLVDKMLTGYPYGNGDNENFYMAFRLKGNILLRKGMFDDIIKMNFQGLRMTEEKKDSVGMALSILGLGNVNNRQQKKREALDWYLKAVNLLPNDEYRKKYSYFYNNIAIVYYKLAREDSMFYFIDKGLAYSSQGSLTDYANSNFLKGGMLAEFGKTAEAESYFKKGLDLRKQVGDIYYIVSDMAQTALFYLNSKQYQKGIDICNDGINLMRQNNFSTANNDLYQSLARNYKAAGRYEEAEQTMETFVRIKDSLYEKNSADLMAEMQTKYEVQKKENTIIQQKYDLTKKNYFIYGIAGILAATLLLGYVFFRNRKKTQLLKLQQIEAEQKQKTTQAVMQAEEEERKRIAGDLHDSVAQKMVVAKMNLESLGNTIKEMTGPEQKIYQNIASLLEESTTEVRNLSHSMMPQAFAHSGLTDAVKDFLDKISNSNLIIHFSAEGEFKTIPENKALMIYRIIQETVQNVLKHAKATTLDVAMIAENNEVDITIEDNGVGFDLNEVAENSMGMKNILSRISYLGGKLDINSRPGSGTVMAFYIPME